MRIKKYTASSMKEALLMVKKDLGENTMILKTHKLPKKMFAFNDQNSIEITAAIDETELKSQPPVSPIKVNNLGVYNHPKLNQKPTLNSVKTGLFRQEKKISRSNRNSTLTQQANKTDRFQFLEIKDDIREMKELLNSFFTNSDTTTESNDLTGSWALLYKRLINSEIQKDIAENLIHQLKDVSDSSEKNIGKKFFSILRKNFPVAGPLSIKSNKPLIAAFVGPTGAGKTTTIAKLASYYNINKKSKVSLITADTYRIAAIEQIRTFAEIVNINLHVVFSTNELVDVLKLCQNDDIVFVDTAGRSQRNLEHMNHLEKLLAALKPDETHLVLSSTTKDSDLYDTVKRYNKLNINRLLFTKLDETIHLGNVFNLASKSAISVSYLTSGQSVPDDIELAQSGRFVKKLLQGSMI